MRVENFLSAFSGKPGDPGMRARDSSPRACKSGIQLDGDTASGRAYLHDVIQRRPRTWDKTVRVEATAIPE